LKICMHQYEDGTWGFVIKSDNGKEVAVEKDTYTKKAKCYRMVNILAEAKNWTVCIP